MGNDRKLTDFSRSEETIDGLSARVEYFSLGVSFETSHGVCRKRKKSFQREQEISREQINLQWRTGVMRATWKGPASLVQSVLSKLRGEGGRRRISSISRRKENVVRALFPNLSSTSS